MSGLENLTALILAGGQGTRLRTVVDDRPKPMAIVAGRPFAEWLVLELRAQGLRRVVFCTGYRGEFIENYFGDGRSWNLEILYSHEAIPLGTAGALRQASRFALGDRFLALNGDSYTPFEVERLQEMHQTRRARASLWLVRVEDCRRYGSVEVDAEGAIRRFEEKVTGTGARPGLISAGVYFLNQDLVASLPEGTAVSLERDVFPAWIGRELFGWVGPGPFFDIGTPESYADSQTFFSQAIR